MKAKWAFLVILLFSWPCDGLAGGIKDGLIGHWGFEHQGLATSTNLIMDESEHGHHGDIDGNVQFEPGVIGRAAVFDGETSIIRIPWSSRLSFGDSDFTIAMWICPEEGGESARVIDHRGAGLAGMYSGWQVNLHASPAGWSLQGTALDDGFGVMARVDFDELRPLKRWAHLSLVFHAGNEIRIFLDGIQVYQLPVPELGVLDNGLPIFIGGTRLANGKEGSSSQLFSGLIDDVRLYNRALNQAEITQLYSLGAHVNCSDASGVHFVFPFLFY